MFEQDYPQRAFNMSRLNNNGGAARSPPSSSSSNFASKYILKIDHLLDSSWQSAKFTESAPTMMASEHYRPARGNHVEDAHWCYIKQQRLLRKFATRWPRDDFGI
jgi:hypothetical protein